MPKQTAVAWLIQELVWEQKIDLDTKMLDLLDKVVAMEGQQIVDAFNQGQQHPYNDWSADQGIQYYNETYNTK